MLKINVNDNQITIENRKGICNVYYIRKLYKDLYATYIVRL